MVKITLPETELALGKFESTVMSEMVPDEIFYIKKYNF